MNYRRLGRSGLQLSSVGFGTAQFRMIPERQAIETLHRGFELGVNLVKYLAVSKRIHTTCGFAGANFRPEFGVSRKVDALYHEMCLADLRRFMTAKRHQTGDDAVFVAMQYIEELEHSVAYHRAVNATPLLSLLRRKLGFH